MRSHSPYDSEGTGTSRASLANSTPPAEAVQGQISAAPWHAFLPYSVGTAIVLLFLVHFVLPACQLHFAPDDPMAIYYYWSRGPWSLVKGLLLFFSTYYRPMGGVFYSVLYHFFGLRPLPYHIAITGLILLNSFLAYRFAWLISDSRLIAGLTALIVIYHAELAALIYLPSFSYDVISFTFFFFALNYYVGIRRRGVLLSKKQALIFLLLYIGALDSKEMVVSLPANALLYEGICNPPGRKSGSTLWSWLRRQALLPLIAAALTLIYIVGKTHGSESLVTNPRYQPLFTWQRFVESNLRFLDTYFLVSFTQHAFTRTKMLLLWAALFVLAWHLRSKHLLFATLFLIIAPLPITFIPLRPGANLYIPLVGWAIVISTVWLAVADVSKRVLPLGRVPLRGLRTVLAVVLVVWLWKSNIRDNRRFLPPLYAMEKQTWSAIEQLKAFQPTVKPGTQIVFLNDPFQGWNMKFIAELLYQDHTVNATLNRLTPLPPNQLANADIVFVWENGRLISLKTNR